MSLLEDLDGFFTDFGVTATFGAETAKVLFDSPENVVAEDYVVTAEYSITYKTGAFTDLAFGDSITVDALAYTVNKIQAIDDGKITRATLSKS